MKAYAIFVFLASSALSFASKAEVLKCQEQILAQRATKTGFSITLKNVPTKEKPSVYLLNGKRVTKEEAVEFAVKNMKPVVQQSRSN